ncbi:transmembrane and immunoglobulin domain-containing protein 1 [Aulostomus maculatus]
MPGGRADRALTGTGVTIQSVPDANSEGFIQTDLEKTVSLVCQTDALPDQELVWLRNGAVVRLEEGNKKGNSSVCITPVIHEDNGATFTCQLRKDATVQASVTLNVTFPPELSESEDVAVEIGAALVLQCNIFANPPVSSVLWTLNGSTVDLLAGGFTVSNDGFTSQLKTDNVERDLHEGRYQCTANSPVYGAHSKFFQVSVMEKTIKFPLMPMIAGLVVVFLTTLLAIFSRWERIVKCCK